MLNTRVCTAGSEAASAKVQQLIPRVRGPNTGSTLQPSSLFFLLLFYFIIFFNFCVGNTMQSPTCSPFD